MKISGGPSQGLTMLAGSTTVQLPDNFKELHTGDSPVRVFDTNEGYSRPLPCIVLTKREIEREYSKFSYGVLNSYFRYQLIRLPVYMDQSNGVWTINILQQAITNINFLVDYFGFIPTPQNAEDTNYLLSNYEEMCMAKAKEIVWTSVNDEIAEEFASLFNRELKQCAADDSYRMTRGVRMQM